MIGRPNTPQCRDTIPHRMFTDDELIKKKDIFDLIRDDDDIDWKHNFFDVDSVEGSEEDPEQLMSQITLKDPHSSRQSLRHWYWNLLMYLLLRFFVNQPAAVEPMKIVIQFRLTHGRPVDTPSDSHVIVHHLVSIQRRSRKRYVIKSMNYWKSE